MAKKEQKKSSKKSPTKETAKAKKVAAKAKKAAAPAKKAAAPKKKSTPKMKTAAKSGKAFSIPEFAKMTYLTENGVTQWLQQGLLKGQQDAKGKWQVDASNLEAPNVKRLVR